MTKIEDTIKKALEKTFWVSHKGKFENSSDYPDIFEQKFGNISLNTIILEDYRVDSHRIDELHEFLKKWNFDVTHQYKINEYKSGNYMSDEMVLVFKCNFGIIDEKVEKEDDEGFVTSDQSTTLCFHFCPLIKNKQAIEQFFKEFVELDILFVPMAEKSFYMIAQNSHGLYKQKTKFKNIEIKDGRYDIYYGERFPHDKFLKFVKEDTENLLLLHGIPGSGKSNYIKNLIMESVNDVIYIPPSMVSLIATPGFVSFMIENKGNTLLIEDAEEILSVDRNSATNNLLGLTDGFLRDSLNLKVICTFNCDLKKIDPALLRKGRLFFEYKFGNLSVAEGQKLADYCELGINVDKEMSLAEIFNYTKEISVEDSFEERPIGFGNF
jgi:hypothetical protein